MKYQVRCIVFTFSSHPHALYAIGISRSFVCCLILKHLWIVFRTYQFGSVVGRHKRTKRKKDTLSCFLFLYLCSVLNTLSTHHYECDFDCRNHRKQTKNVNDSVTETTLTFDIVKLHFINYVVCYDKVGSHSS